MDGLDMSGFLGTISSVFTAALNWVTELLTTITGSPALIVLCLAMPICGFAIGMLTRLLRA